jgi:type IV secretion system protein TrbI
VSDSSPETEPAPTEAERPIQEMRLRSSRAPVTRLSRKVLVSLGLVAAAGISTALFLALRPQPHAARSELYNTNNRTTPDGLANLPRDYAGLPHDVPKLGPPLPGDLGRPILAAGAPAPGMTPQAGAPDPEKQRIAQEGEAARSSHLFSAGADGPSVAGAAQAIASVPAPTVSPPSPASDFTAQDHKLAFLNGAADHRTVSPDGVAAPASPYVLQAGAVIPAALLTGLRSDLPGQVTAQVTQDVYDSPTGRILLIPQGARLVGQYDAQVSFGQSRALLVWNRLILPNGRSIVLERQPGADAQGYAGLEDQIDNHWGMLFKAAVLSTLLSVGSEAGTSDSENNLAQAIRQGASQSFSQVGEQVVGRSLNVQPTITIRPGFPVRVMVTQDLVFSCGNTRSYPEC